MGGYRNSYSSDCVHAVALSSLGVASMEFFDNQL